MVLACKEASIWTLLKLFLMNIHTNKHRGEIISYDRLGSLIVRGTPWDPWTAPWQAFLHLVGEDKYLLYVFGKHSLVQMLILFIISSLSF